MNGRKDHSLSAAGSVPSSTPNQLSISGPLGTVSIESLLKYERRAVHDGILQRRQLGYPYSTKAIYDIWELAKAYRCKMVPCEAMDRRSKVYEDCWQIFANV